MEWRPEVPSTSEYRPGLEYVTLAASWAAQKTSGAWARAGEAFAKQRHRLGQPARALLGDPTTATTDVPSILPKPWGFEELLSCDQYAVKRLHVRAGHRLSLQYHRTKTETLMVHRGLAEILVGDEARLYRPGEFVHIAAGVRHRIAAEPHGDVDLFEVSTLELDDVVRLADDYGRAGRSLAHRRSNAQMARRAR